MWVLSDRQGDRLCVCVCVCVYVCVCVCTDDRYSKMNFS